MYVLDVLCVCRDHFNGFGRNMSRKSPKAVTKFRETASKSHAARKTPSTYCDWFCLAGCGAFLLLGLGCWGLGRGWLRAPPATAARHRAPRSLAATELLHSIPREQFRSRAPSPASRGSNSAAAPQARTANGGSVAIALICYIVRRLNYFVQKKCFFVETLENGV